MPRGGLNQRRDPFGDEISSSVKNSQVIDLESETGAIA
jgi:hypothetical protein